MMNKYIYNDSFSILPTLKEKSFHMILTDPPYNFDDQTKLWLHNQFLRICSGVIIVFSPWKNPWILPCNQKLIWTKQISTKNTSKNYSNFIEEIFVYGRNEWNTSLHWSNYVNILTDRVDSTEWHPWRKPPSMIERFIKIHTNPK